MKKFITIFLVTLVTVASVFAADTTFKMNDKVALEDFTFTADIGYGGVSGTGVMTGAIGARWAMAETSINFDGYSLPGTVDLVATVRCATEFKNFGLPELAFGAGFTADIAENIFTTFDVNFVMAGMIARGSDFTLALGFDLGVGFGYQINDMIGVYVKGEFTDLYNAQANSVCWASKAGATFNF